jgi:hypothetical protein
MNIRLEWQLRVSLKMMTFMCMLKSESAAIFRSGFNDLTVLFHIGFGDAVGYKSPASMIFSAYVSLHLSHSAAYTALPRIHFSSFLSLYKLVLLTSYLAFVTRYFNTLLVIWPSKD